MEWETGNGELFNWKRGKKYRWKNWRDGKEEKSKIGKLRSGKNGKIKRENFNGQLEKVKWENRIREIIKLERKIRKWKIINWKWEKFQWEKDN